MRSYLLSSLSIEVFAGGIGVGYGNVQALVGTLRAAKKRKVSLE